MNDHSTAELKSEFLRPVDVTTLPQTGRHYKFDATPEERAALSERFGILAIDAFLAECFLKPVRGQKGVRYQLDASIKAEIVQACSITLEPVPETVEDSFTVLFVDKDFDELVERQEIEFAYDEEDIEPLTGNEVDLGEQLAQHLSLAMNPYPRKQGARGDELGYKILQKMTNHWSRRRKIPLMF